MITWSFKYNLITMRMIVSGGAGFLGSHLVHKLIAEGHEVICVDNLSTGQRENIKDLESNPNFKFINYDVSTGLPEGLSAEAIYHLASPASPNKHNPKSYLALGFETMRVNSDGTWKLAEAALKMGAKFLFASTSEVYGDPLEHPQKESYKGNVSTTGPRSVYDESKRFGETITAALFREKGLDGRIIRIFNTYGERMGDDGRVVVSLIKQALKGEPLTIYGDGSQSRSFCYVSDLIEGIVKAMDTEGTKGEIFNLGNSREYTVLELAQKIKQLTDSESEIKMVEPLPEDDPLKRQPDITKAKEKLGWEPKVTLEEGLKKLIEYVRNTSA